MTIREEKTYVADDGRVFLKEAECFEYERTLKAQFFAVVHSADLTEGRGLMGMTILIVRCAGSEHIIESLVSDFCYQKWGRPIAFAQGVAAVENWKYRPMSRAEFEIGNHYIQFGDYKHNADTIVLKVGHPPLGLVEEAQ